MRFTLKHFLVCCVLFALNGSLFSQTSEVRREEVWPEIDIFYKLTKKLRLFTYYSGTKLKNSSYTDGGFGLYADYFALPDNWKAPGSDYKDTTRAYYLWLRGGYQYSSSPPEATDPFKEHQFISEVNMRYYLPLEIVMNFKNRFDFRATSGELFPRYRPRINLEKDLRTEYLYFTPYIYGEYFFNFGVKDLDRFRLAAGAEIKITKYLNFEFYYLFQFDNGEEVDDLSAAGFALKFYFQRKHLRKQIAKKRAEQK